MTRHSKNITSSGVFSYAERQKLSQYGTQSVRCSSENLRPPTHCHLCLQEAKQPNCCRRGHLACRECFLQDILAQKEAQKRVRAETAAQSERLKAEEAKKADAAQEAKVKDFLEQQQAGAKRVKVDDTGKTAAAVKADQQSLLLTSSQVHAQVHPHAQNQNNESKTPKDKDEICCRGGGKDASHPLSLKSLITVNIPASGACPSCQRPLKSSVKFLVAKDCGHVACHACHEKIKPKHCFTCSREIKEALTVCSEGTGFAAGGGTTEASRYDLGFQ